jgi:hypothetical protein
MSNRYSRRFNGPSNVKATPNRAVRVGNTQSACQFDEWSVRKEDDLINATDHVNT